MFQLQSLSITISMFNIEKSHITTCNITTLQLTVLQHYYITTYNFKHCLPRSHS